MNFYENGINKLKENGVPEEYAKKIMQNVIKDSKENPQSINRIMHDRWNEDITDAPPLILNLVYYGIEPFALEFIKERCPDAFFRPVFDKEHPLRKEFDSRQKV